MKKDITVKEIIQAITEDLAKYILNIEIKDIKFIDKELKRIEKREADIVALCQIDGSSKILHIEIQNDNQNIMPRRMLRYYNDIKIRFPNIEVLQYLIYIGKKRVTMQSQIKEQHLYYEFKIIDMHQVDCEKLIKLDTPDTLVLSILCDFKGKDERDILLYIIKRLEELVDDTNELGKYMLMLETLSENRNLKSKLKEAENMLREIKFENLPSYEIGLEQGIKEGIEKGIQDGIKMVAKQMIDMDIDIQTIKKVTKLSIKEIENLKK